MDALIIILAIAAGIIGIAGSILPGLPGTPFSWVGLLLLYFWGPEEMPMRVLIVWGIVTVIISVVDYIVPMYFTKMTGGSKFAGRGALIGLFAGMIFTPIGMIFGSFLGAFIAELCYAKKDAIPALRAALGSFIGFMLGTGAKTIVACMIMWKIIVFL